MRNITIGWKSSQIIKLEAIRHTSIDLCALYYHLEVLIENRNVGIKNRKN